MTDLKKRPSLLKRCSMAPVLKNLAVTFSEAELYAVHEELGVDQYKQARDSALASTYTLQLKDGYAVIVHFHKMPESAADAAETAAHEAVHVWFRYAELYGMKADSEEHVAYAVQFLTAHILSEYLDRCSPSNNSV